MITNILSKLVLSFKNLFKTNYIDIRKHNQLIKNGVIPVYCSESIKYEVFKK